MHDIDNTYSNMTHVSYLMIATLNTKWLNMPIKGKNWHSRLAIRTHSNYTLFMRHFIHTHTHMKY